MGEDNTVDKVQEVEASEPRALSAQLTQSRTSKQTWQKTLRTWGEDCKTSSILGTGTFKLAGKQDKEMENPWRAPGLGYCQNPGRWQRAPDHQWWLGWEAGRKRLDEG